MAYTYYIDPNVNCVFVRHFGDFPFGEGFDAVEEILRDPEHRAGMNFLRDSRTTSRPKIEFKKHVSEVSILAKSVDKHLGKHRSAYVVGSAADFAYVHRWAAATRLSTIIKRKPFREIEKAREWLSIPEDYEIKYPEPEKNS